MGIVCGLCVNKGKICCADCLCEMCEHGRCAGCGAPSRLFSMKEIDPNGISQHEPGAKLDDGKVLAGILSDFSLAFNAVAEVGTFGANKYSRGGWQSVPNGVERYSDALWRHLLAERHEGADEDSGLLHQAHLAWNALARLELMLREK